MENILHSYYCYCLLVNAAVGCFSKIFCLVLIKLCRNCKALQTLYKKVSPRKHWRWQISCLNNVEQLRGKFSVHYKMHRVSNPSHGVTHHSMRGKPSSSLHSRSSLIYYNTCVYKWVSVLLKFKVWLVFEWSVQKDTNKLRNVRGKKVWNCRRNFVCAVIFLTELKWIVTFQMHNDDNKKARLFCKLDTHIAFWNIYKYVFCVYVCVRHICMQNQTDKATNILDANWDTWHFTEICKDVFSDECTCVCTLL